MTTRGFGKVIDRDKGWKKVKEQVKALKRSPMAVIGIRGKLALEPKKSEDGTSEMTLVAIATVHEYGNTRVPERSFIRATVDQNKGTYAELLSKLKDRVLNPNDGITVREALLIVGEKVKLDIQRRIRAGIPPPWAESTRQKRIAKGGGGIIAETPLIDTGQLIGSITNDVEERK